jgi:alpha-ketoglutarate-dependent taurine dioxygenase
MAFASGPSVDYSVDRDVARALADPGPTASARELWRNFEAQFRNCARRHLAGRPGYFLLSGLELSEAEARRFVLRASRMLGEPLPHDSGGAPIRDVADRGSLLETTSTVRYSDTRHGGNLHTDGCHRPGHVPDLFALYCVRQASSGGALVLVHVSDLLDRLSDEPGVLEALRLPVHFDTRDRTPGAPRTVRRPILETVDGAPRISYLREYIDSAHCRPDVPPLAADQVRALDVLDALLDRTDLHTRRRLRPGEMIVIDNRSVIHGRTTFPAEVGPAGRLLLRVWIAASGGAFGASVSQATVAEPADENSAGLRP